MKITIIKFNGDKITKDIDKFELRRNQVVCWYKYNNTSHNIDDVATIKIEGTKHD